MPGGFYCKGYDHINAGRTVFGTIGQSEYIIRKIKEESGFLDAKVVATGGLGKIISEHTDEIQVYDSDLTLRGLQIIYDKQKK